MINIQNEIAAHFNKYHQVYLDTHGETIQCESLDDADPMLEWLGQIIDLKENDNVLDCGSGVGYPAAFLSNRFNCNVLGLNITDKQLSFCEKYKSEKCDFVKFNFEEMDKLPIGYKPDKIIFLETFGYAEKPEELLMKCAERLNNKGLLLIKSFFVMPVDMRQLEAVEKFYCYRAFPPQEITKWSMNAGLLPLLFMKTTISNYEKNNRFLSVVDSGLTSIPKIHFYVLILRKE